MISKVKAANLVKHAKTSLRYFYKAISEIIEQEAWRPLGYDNFTKLYEAEFSGMPLAEEMKAPIIYAMLNDHVTDYDINKAMPRVGPSKIASARRQKEAGIPADKAYLSNVSAHSRKMPPKKFWARAELTKKQHNELVAIGEAYGKNIGQMTLEAIEEYIAKYKIDDLK